MPNDRTGIEITVDDFVRVLRSNLGSEGEHQVGRVMKIHAEIEECNLEVAVPVRTGPGPAASAIIRMQTETAHYVEIVERRED